MDRIKKLHEFGQSLWYDNIERKMLENGQLARLIERGEIRGVTSNPSIFNKAIGESHDYDAALKAMAWAGWSAEQIFDQLAIEDIRAAADLFLPLYQQTSGADGYVSLEVSPFLARDTAATVAEAKRLWAVVDRPNLMVKIPATREGIDAIRQCITAGLNINVTLIFSLERYHLVMDAYLTGLEERLAAGQPVSSVASVASFFVSRMDTKVDARLEKLAEQGQHPQARDLLGKAAIANARLAYEAFQHIFQSERFERLRKFSARVQRPLWASTSTKNPSYVDVLYVEELIAPQSVNTVPPQTLDAFRDHGRSRLSIYEDLDGATRVLRDLESLGISVDQVTHELEEEGVKSFADAFTQLLATVNTRRAAALREVGPLADALRACVADLDQHQAARRLYARDATLWKPDADAATQRGIVERLGWLDLPTSSRAALGEYERFAAQCVDAGFTHVLLLGMGGSSLAPETMRLTFGLGEVGGKPGLDLAILDSTDPAQVRAAAQRSPVEKTLYIVSSKSGGTSEVNAFFNYFWERATQALGERAGANFIAITDPGTSLEELAHKRGFRKVFLADPTVGGRYSALTAFGLVPAALMGIDVGRLLDRAAWMAAQCQPEMPSGRNPGLVLGALMGVAAQQGRDKLTLLADPDVSALGAWLEQLIAESSGKEGKGIVPVDLEPVIQPDSYSADRLFVYLRRDGYWAKIAESLPDYGQPAITLDIQDAYDLGAEFYRWEVATAFACAVLGVNAFDQPDVQDNKNRTTAKVAAYREKGGFEEGAPLWENEEARLYGAPFDGLRDAHNLADAIRAFLQQAKDGDYIAINAYLPRNPRTLEQLQNLRAVIQRTTGKATTLGFGPRFLHSTGQLHKGGANNGVFLQITSDPTTDPEIPEEGIRFGVLERAQALGDLEALLARGRRILRVHLTGGELSDCVDC